MPVAVLLDELKHEDLQVRLASVRQLSTIGEAHGRLSYRAASRLCVNIAATRPMSSS